MRPAKSASGEEGHRRPQRGPSGVAASWDRRKRIRDCAISITLAGVNTRLVVPMIFVVLAVWLVGAAVTKYSLERMALYTPIAMIVLGATAALLLLWVKVVLQLLRARRQPGSSA